MRIVGGRLRGRDLVSPNDFRVRPTAEAVRAALLDALADEISAARVLDLFAGTGALGLEALSRGAQGSGTTIGPRGTTGQPSDHCDIQA